MKKSASTRNDGAQDEALHQPAPEEGTTAEDPTEQARRALVVAVNAEGAGRRDLEARHGQVWSTSELASDFEVTGFAAPFVAVKRKSDDQVGSLMFQHHPRFYFSFQEAHA